MPISDTSMQAAQPLLLYGRTSTLAALRMLSSTTSSLNPRPNLNRDSNPDPRLLHCGIKSPATESSSKTPNSSLFSNPKFNPNFLNFPQSPSPVKCLSVSPVTNSMPISSQSPMEIEKCEAAAGDVTPGSTLVVVSFYKFADFPDHADFRKPLKELCEELRVSGSIILASEGINGSICGTRNSVEKVLTFIENDNRLRGLRRVESPVSPEEEAIHHGHTSSLPLAAGEDAPFRWDHVRVKLKKEIVTLGMPSVSPIERVGKYVSPSDWNTLISDPNVVVIDVRNDYESRIGKFKGAIDPSTSAFRDFPSWVENEFKLEKPEESACSIQNADTAEKGEKMLPRVAMYCTGGIRCEKASSFLLSKGFKEVYHLQGGILKYLEEVPETESLWVGECFVFDKRVSVEHGLVPGTFKLCYGCKKPVSDADMEAPEWEYGVSCPYCYSTKSEEEKERARARQKQFERWGIIGGPDKGRRPVKTMDHPNNLSATELSKSS